MKAYGGGLTLLVSGLLAVWVVATAALLGTVGVRDGELLQWALLAAVVVLPLARPFPGAGAIMATVAVATLFGAQIYRNVGATGSVDPRALALPTLQLVPGALALVVASVLSGSLAHLVRRGEERAARDAKAIDALSNVDDLTGVLKSVYADRLLSVEVERARRYKRSLSVLLFGPDDWQAVVRTRGREQADEALVAVGLLLKEKLRTVDSVSRYNESQFIAILPETPSAGAQIVADRMCQAIVAKTQIQFRAGVAEFPADAVSKEELIGEADAALRFAHSVGVSAVSRDMLA